MSSKELIDAQFVRAVEIVQALPKTGPIQTGYEEKLTMYSLYKQATIGNVKPPRPGFLDMLGRAKWDAWAKHKDLDSYEAKWLYIDALLKVLRKYSDRTIARDLVKELESYGGDPGNLVSSRALSRSPESDSSGSTASNDVDNFPRQSHLPPQPRLEDESELSEEDEARDLPIPRSELLPSHMNRPQSSLSSHRYRTPLTGSLAMSPPPPHGVPATQPRSGFETPSAFAEPTSHPSSVFPASSLTRPFSASSRPEQLVASPNLYPTSAHYRGTSQSLPIRQYDPVRPASRPTLERAIENVQAHLAALTERLESLESMSYQPQRSNASLSPGSRASPAWATGRGSPAGSTHPVWDLDDLGMWSVVLNPLSKGVASLKDLARFFGHNENRSPALIIIRRLVLDVSFLLCVLAAVRAIWRASGVRRKEVYVALVVLWRALIGTKRERTTVDRGV